jgi:DNA-binding transcriptional MerR regulator
MTDSDLQQASRTTGKSAAAFRTISEVSAELNVPQHVLRFWETKFSQLRPLKRGGGRRYYRPEDVELLRRIHRLLYAEGYTIKGVQRLLRAPKGANAEHAHRSAEDEHGEAPDNGGSSAAMLVPGLDEDADAGSGGGPAKGMSPRQRQELEEILQELRELRRMLRS